MLLQNPEATGDVKAACFVSSFWSRSYKLLHCPSEKIHRDFHYQCLFTAMQILAEVGCNVFRAGNLMSGYLWQRDALVCLLEALRNIRSLVNPDFSVELEIGSYDRNMVEYVTANLSQFNPEAHRPIRVTPYVREGFSMHRIVLKEFGKGRQ